jgi:hypothetical protein
MLLADPRMLPSQHVGTPIVFKFPPTQENERPYLTVLYETGGQIVDGECSCPASTTCYHLLAALASAHRDGLKLSV